MILKNRRPWVVVAGILVALPWATAPARASYASAQERPRVTVEVPEIGAEPGSVTLRGRVEGELPVTVRVAGKKAHVSDTSATWWLDFVLAIGNHRFVIEAEDGAGRTAETVVHELLVYPGFRRDDRREIIRVDDAAEFLEALAPNRIVALRPGRYDLGAVKQRELPNVEWRDGNVRVFGLSEVDILGAADGGSVILTKGDKKTTLVLDDSRRIRLHGLRLLHEGVADDSHGGGAFTLRASAAVLLNGCEFSGVGVGLTTRGVNGCRLQDCVIRDCTRGILRVENSSVDFIDTEFVGNGRGESGDHGVVISGRSRGQINFLRCRLLENRVGPKAGLFRLGGGSLPVYFMEGEIRGNQARALVSGRGMELFEVRESQVQDF